MAKTESVNVPDELRPLYNGALEQSDRYVFSTIQAHKSLPSDKRRKAIKEMSLFRFLSPLWRGLTDEQKQVWRDAAVYSNLSGWQLFISDNAARVRNDLPLDIPPSELWQVRAGRLVIQSPASEIILKQEHPLDYWVAQKIRGAPWKQELVLLRETFSLPLTLEIRYKSDLVAAPGYMVPTTAGTVSGTVTLNSSPVENAVIRCIRQSDNVALAQQVTDSSGEYIFTGLDENELYHLAVEYESEGQRYNALSLWAVVSVVVNFELSEYTPPEAGAVNFELTPFTDEVPRARYFARVWTSYQGQDIETDFAINFDPVADWTEDTISTTGLKGILIGYTLFIDIQGYRGELLFDNIRAVHSGQNWARDPRCDEVNKIFKKAFAVVPPFWVPVSLPTGAEFYSAYPPSLS